MVKNRIRVLISAYACEPNKGSEPGVGWNWTLQMAKMDEVYVITRSNNRKVIETFLQKHPVEKSALLMLYILKVIVKISNIPWIRINWMKKK